MSKSQIIDAAQEVGEIAFKHRDETEQLRRLAPAVSDKLRALELCRLGLPKSLGGWEDNPVEVLKVYEILSNSEASLAWTVWNNHLACTFGRFLDVDSLKEIYNNTSHCYSNSARPEGVAKVVPGGYEVTGRWSLVSGCELADWLALRCLVTSPDLPSKLGPGALLKIFYLPKDAVEIIDTWSVGGLRGTGSHDVEVKGVFVKEKYAISFDDPVQIDTAYNRLPIGCINSAGCAAMAIGLVKKAIDELIRLGIERATPGKSPDMRDRLHVQAAVASGMAKITAVRSHLHNCVETIWKEAQEGNRYTDIQLADVWAASHNAATTSRTVLSDIYAVAGTVSLYTKFPIERVHRDIYAVLQHGIIQPLWMNQAGMAYLGITPTGAMFRK
jgi:alkylation response protein AidB-like acyl-CoA dehydrogenase